MYFYHSDTVWSTFPTLSVQTIILSGVRSAQPADTSIEQTLRLVSQRLENITEGEMQSIRAWRQAYSKMGFKPTQYRCAAEALLRRFRKDRNFPRFHPLVDMLNAESMLAGIPIAAFDCENIVDGICVRPATGTESYLTFQGSLEQPVAGEIIFADAQQQAHSRRWVFRQSAKSVVSNTSNTVLVVAEALHDTAFDDLTSLRKRIETCAAALRISVDKEVILTSSDRRLEFSSEGGGGAARFNAARSGDILNKTTLREK